MVSDELVKATGASHEGKLRLLEPGDISAAMDLSSLAGWNQTADDWRRLIELDRKGCFAIEVEGSLAGTTTLMCYGERLAWVGMVLTRPEYRRQGFAHHLLTLALRRADQLGIQTVKLDATEQGQSLYESLGFRAEQAVERWARDGLADAKPKITNQRWQKDWAEFDLEAFGVDRSSLLRLLAEYNPPTQIGRAYVFSRLGRLSSYIGPCVSLSRKSASHLIEQCMSATAAVAWSWDLLPSNHNARALAVDLGFKLQRRLLRMVRGKDLKGKEESVYAIAGFEFG